MSVSTTVVAKETPEIVEFSQLKSRTAAEALRELVSEYGTVYVMALTRQGCSGCETQKPLYKSLAEKMSMENPEKVRFRSFHVNYQDGDKRESWNSKGNIRPRRVPDVHDSRKVTCGSSRNLSSRVSSNGGGGETDKGIFRTC